MADNERVYVIEGKDYPSVTTILGATIAKQNFLIPWAIKGYHEQVSKWVQKNKAWTFHHSIDAVIDSLNVDETRDALMEARDTTGYKPARIGNVVHAIISQSIHAGWDGNNYLIDTVLELLDSTSHMGWTATGDELVQMFEDEGLTFDRNMNPSEMDGNSETYNVYSCLVAWQQWLKDFGLYHSDSNQRFIISDTEKLVHHREHHVKGDFGKPLYAGTVDLILTDKKNPRRKYLIDIKTGTVSEDAMYQVAAYANAYNDMSVSQHMAGVDKLKDIPTWGEVPSIDRCFILQLQRTKSKYVLKEANDWYSLYRSGFAKANEWFLTQKEHTLGRQVKPSDFQGEKAAVK